MARGNIERRTATSLMVRQYSRPNLVLSVLESDGASGRARQRNALMADTFLTSQFSTGWLARAQRTALRADRITHLTFVLSRFRPSRWLTEL